jgi:hypothetical protein
MINAPSRDQVEKEYLEYLGSIKKKDPELIKMIEVVGAVHGLHKDGKPVSLCAVGDRLNIHASSARRLINRALEKGYLMRSSKGTVFPSSAGLDLLKGDPDHQL